MRKTKYHNRRPMLDMAKAYNAKYIMCFGRRGNGKTWEIKDIALNGDPKTGIPGYIKEGKQSAYIRRDDTDLKGYRAKRLFDDVVNAGKIEEWTDGAWTDVVYKEHAWWLAKFDETLNKIVCDARPFMFAFSLSVAHHDKSVAFPNVSNVFFDEFLTTAGYLPDEWATFLNTLSTIKRNRDDVTVFFYGNTISTWCPYFTNFGINVRKLKQGEVIPIVYGEEGYRIIVEFCADSGASGKAARDPYFAFKDNTAKMITSGTWDIQIYPTCPQSYERCEIVNEYYIKFDRELLHAEMIYSQGNFFTFIHRKTTPIKDGDKHMVFQQEWDPRPNYRRSILRPSGRQEKIIISQFMKDKVFYQDNEVGDIVHNYLLWCKKEAAV